MSTAMEPKPASIPPTDTTDTAAAADKSSAAAPPPAPAAPVSKPYVYRDFAQDDTDYGGDDIPTTDGRGLSNQKLPAKLNAMLSDPDLVTCITWMPHGRSWKILNRDLFSRFALPKYFGHTNHASFIRIVNAWGFRRVVATGPDRDTYYHELFLRGKNNLHVKMKRLPSTHRKTPMDKNDSSPNFYEMSEKSPLPENVWLPQAGLGGHRGAPSAGAGGGGGGGMPPGMMGAHHPGMAMPPHMGGGGRGGMVNPAMNRQMQLMQQQPHHPSQQHLMGHHPSMSGMMPGMGMMSAAAAGGAPFGYPPAAGGVGGSPSAGGRKMSDNDTLTTLQRENDSLMRQLLQLQSQMNPPKAAAEEGSAAAAVIALQRDNERLIRQVMQLQEQLPQELRMQIPVEELMPGEKGQGSSQKKQVEEEKVKAEEEGETKVDI